MKYDEFVMALMLLGAVSTREATRNGSKVVVYQIKDVNNRAWYIRVNRKLPIPSGVIVKINTVRVIANQDEVFDVALAKIQKLIK